MDGTVLVADDDRTIRTVLTQALTRAGCKVHATSSLTTLMRWVEEGRGDLVITDVMMPDGNGIELIPRIGQERPGLPVIVISAQNTIMTAIQAAEAEAWDYLPKPFDLPDLMKRAGRAMQARRPAPRAVPEGPPPREDGMDGDLPLVGRTAAMQALYRLIARVLNSDMPVLITGESGTGKSLIARTLHDLSDRRALPCITVASEELRSPDTAASVLARARGGTLIFDELGDYDDDAQARVVRLLDGIASDQAPRVLATSQSDLSARMAQGALREDLFYRISGVTLDVPPLRARIDDLPLLADHFLTRAAGSMTTPRQLSDEALELVRTYSWPGNLRQLENAMRRLQLTGQEPAISRAEMEQVLRNQPAMEPLRPGATGEKLSDSVAAHLRRYFDLHGGELPPAGLYARILREVEAPLLEIALEATSGNQARCAELRGINRNTLRKKVLDLDIRVTRRRKLM